MKTRKLAIAALLISLSLIGANIKLMGTIALDSMSAFVGSLVLGPVYGAGIGLAGHLFSALMSGFPFGALIHGVIGGLMAVTMLGFGFVYKKLLHRVSLTVCVIATGVVGIILNGPVSLLLSYPLLAPVIGLAGVLAMLPTLITASIINIILAFVLFKTLTKVWEKTI